MLFHTMNDLRLALTEKLGDEKFNNHGDVNYLEYGGTQLKWSPQHDEVTAVQLYTPDDGLSGWEIREAIFDLNDLLFNQRQKDEAHDLYDSLPLYNVALLDRAKSFGTVIGVDKDAWGEMVGEGIEENDCRLAEYLAELVIQLVHGAIGYGGWESEHRTLAELPNGMTLKDTYGDEEAAEVFEEKAKEAEAVMLKWGLDIEPDYNHLTKSQRGEMQTDFGRLNGMGRDVAKLAAKSAGCLSDDDEPLALHYIPQLRKQLEEAQELLQSIEDGYYEKLDF